MNLSTTAATTSSASNSTPPHNLNISQQQQKLNGMGTNSNQTIASTTNATISSLGSAHQLVHDLSSTTASTSTPLSATTGDRSANRISAPPVEIKLFVGRVPKTFDDAQLRAVFSEFGVVRDVIIIRDRDTGTHKGCAFVRMASITKADAAIRQLNNIRVLDSSLGPLQVKYAFGEPERLGLLIENCQPGVDQAKLFVGSLPKTAAEEEIHGVFSRFGDVDEVFVMKDEQKVSKGCAFVRFAFKEEAFNAIANLNGKFTMSGGTRAMEVRFAENKKSQQQQQNPYGSLANPLASSLRPPNTSGWLEYVSPEGRPYYYSIQTGHTQWERPGELDVIPPVVHTPQHPNVVPGGVGAQTHGPPGANVFIFHIPNDWSEHDLVSSFSPFGQIVSARIATDKTTGRRLGFGFVSYSTIEASVQAVMALNGFSVSGKRLKVTIKRGEEQYSTPFLPTGFGSQQSSGNNSSRLPQPQNSTMSSNNQMGSNSINNQHSAMTNQTTAQSSNHPHSDQRNSSQPQSSSGPRSQHPLPFHNNNGNHNNGVSVLGNGHPLSTMGQSTMGQSTMGQQALHHHAHAQYPNIPNYPSLHHPHSQNSFSNFPSSLPYSNQQSSVIPPTATIAH